MSKRYTFRITRKTQWLEDVIESIEKKDQSDFIREMVIAGLRTTNQVSVVSQTFVPSVSPERQPNDRHLADKRQTLVKKDELDDKLDNMYA